MSILDEFESSYELVAGFSEYGVPLVCIYDFDSAIDELKQCYSEIKDKENIIVELSEKELKSTLFKCNVCGSHLVNTSDKE